ncbi:MAG TPA: DUF4384 domain-containing protein, partial [Gemmatimonadales bacterium]|nr:DUF4384 domain-containing protein [Gemmatimonadales bacterium]
MVLALVLSLVGTTPVNAPALVASIDDPPIKVWLNQDSYFQRGDRAQVHVKLAQDGYLIVLRADANGRVRVLFPLDPSDDAFARGGQTFEVRGRGDREAFAVDEREGTGVVLAARSTAPFKVDEFVRGDHWDYRVLDAHQAGDDKEAVLLDLVQRMAPDGHFDYDAEKYFIASPRAAYDNYYPSYRASFGYGWPRHYGFGYGFNDSCYDPFFYDPFYCGAGFSSPYFYDPFFYGSFYYPSYGYGYYQPYGSYPGGFLYTGVAGRPMIFKNAPGTTLPVRPVGPRLRIPQGVLLTRSTPTSVGVRSRDAALSAQTTRPVLDRNVRPLDRNDRPGIRAVSTPRSAESRDARGGEARAAAPDRQGGGRSVARPSSGGGGSRPSYSGGGSRSSGGGGRSASGGGGGGGGGGGRSSPSRGGGGGGGGGRSSGGGGGRSGGG